MSPPRLAAIVLAAGRSTRFKGDQPKVLHPLCGRPVLGHILETLREVHRSTKIAEVRLVVSPGKQVEQAFADASYPFTLSFAVQRNARGTGDAARVGTKGLKADEVLLLAGDAPLVRASSLVGLVRRRREADAGAALLTATLDDGGPYGRIVRAGDWITGVVEARDATEEQLAIREINTCTYVFSGPALGVALPKLTTDNDQGELLLTDVIGEIAADGGDITSADGHPDEVLGTNTRAEYATNARLLRERILEAHMADGVTVIDPASTYIDADVTIQPDTTLLPNTFLEGATSVAERCEIGPNTRLIDTSVGAETTITMSVTRDAKIGAGCEVGPFAHLRPGTVLKDGAKAGTYSEMKNAVIGEGAKVPHFSYMGDVTVGAGSNIGAGTITCNYDGKDKHPTRIGDDVFIGSDSILVAPVRVGRGAYTGAGSVVTEDVKAGDLVYGVPARRRERAEPKRSKAKRSKAKRKPSKAKASKPKPASRKRKPTKTTTRRKR